jgi:hypothetical protein
MKLPILIRKIHQNLWEFHNVNLKKKNIHKSYIKKV